MLNNYRFVEYIPVKCSNKFVQSAVNAHREGDKNPNSSAVAKTMNILANTPTVINLWIVVTTLSQKI